MFWTPVLMRIHVCLLWEVGIVTPILQVEKLRPETLNNLLKVPQTVW